MLRAKPTGTMGTMQPEDVESSAVLRIRDLITEFSAFPGRKMLRGRLAFFPRSLLLRCSNDRSLPRLSIDRKNCTVKCDGKLYI